MKLKSKKEEYQNEISNRNQKSKWVDWVNEWGNRLDEMKRDDFKLEDKRKFLKTIIEKIVVKSKDKLEHEYQLYLNSLM